MSAGTIRSMVSEHPRLLGVAFALTVQLAAVSPVSAGGCWDWFIGP